MITIAGGILLAYFALFLLGATLEGIAHDSRPKGRGPEWDHAKGRYRRWDDE